MALITPIISVVIAARNEAPRLPLLLADLAAGWELLKEIVVVDGSSTDASPRVAALAGAQVLACPPGRGGSSAWELKAAAAPGYCCCMPMPACQSAGSRPWQGQSTAMGQNKSIRPGIST